MDNFRALPKLNEKLEEMVSSGEARLATVVASYGNEVEVIVTGGARARFPSTHYDPPVGSSGALIATRGGGRLFIPMGIAIPIPFAALVASSRFSTNEISNFATGVMVSPSTITVPVGSYRIRASAIVSGNRTVDSGGIMTRLHFGGVNGPEALRVVDSATPGGSASTAIFDDVVETDASGSIPIEFHARGNGTAATTRLYRGVLNGTLTRIG